MFLLIQPGRPGFPFTSENVRMHGSFFSRSISYVILASSFLIIEYSSWYQWKDVERLQRTHTCERNHHTPHQPTCRIAKARIYLNIKSGPCKRGTGKAILVEHVILASYLNGVNIISLFLSHAISHSIS